MRVIRPVRREDADKLVDLARSAGTGLTTLPANREVLAGRIDTSIRAFDIPEADAGPDGSTYLFVLEDMEKGDVLGTSAIYSAVGIDRPFYNYRVHTISQRSDRLDIHVTSQILSPVNDYNGWSEVGTLFLNPAHRGGGNGQLLTRCRYLFMANWRNRFARKVFAEMRGFSDERGKSPFWEAVGRHFFQISFSQADYINGIGDYQFIADLMPKYPIYTDLLPQNARDTIGTTHPQTAPALELLKKEGFRYNNVVDIFDGGPCVDVAIDDIRTIRHSREVTLEGGSNKEDSQRHLIATMGDVQNFRCFYAAVSPRGDKSIALPQSVIDNLELEPGQKLRIADMGRIGA